TAACTAARIVTTRLGREPQLPAPPPPSIAKAYTEPLREFLGRPNAFWLLLLLVLYKLGDAFAFSLSTAFLLRGAGFSLADVAVVNKGMAILATVLGALIGGALMVRLRLYKALMLFGALQA